MNFQEAIDFLSSGREYMAVRGEVKIARSVVDGKLFRLADADTDQLYMDRGLQPWVDTGEPWQPSDEDRAADDWSVAPLT